MEKIIHYCWFGGKPLPKLAKKCLKSWKKYLPDYKIIEWNEKNFDINCTKFSKQAYEAKKYAFVSDVARVYALKEYGGIYFDTDMLVTKNIDEIINCDFFAGWESEYNVAVGVLGAKKNHSVINKLWKFYQENEFSVKNAHFLTIPIILTNCLIVDYDLKFNYLEIQKLKEGIVIYAREYFYPISPNKISNMFTKNTCMIHYYAGSWLSKNEFKRIKFYQIFGKKFGDFLLKLLVKIKYLLKKMLKLLYYPIIIYRRKKRKQVEYLRQKKEYIFNIEKLTSNYIVFCNKNWLGTKNVTNQLFDNVVEIEELHDERIINEMADKIIEKKFKLVIFSAFSYGWKKLVEIINSKDSSVKIKIIWHGSLALNVENYDWDMFLDIFSLLNRKVISSIGLVKKSLYEFFKAKGYNVEMIYNTITLDNLSNDNKKLKKDDVTKIGIYSSGDRWIKNYYNQLAAISLFKKVKIDCIPINVKSLKMVKIFGIVLQGLNSSISREKLLERMAKNDINFYVTFSECAPLIPLESLELGVPCITGNNHHYWEGTELRKYLVVDEIDNVMSIYEKAKLCLENKEKILKMYKEWKKDYDKIAKESVKKFLK